MTQAFHALKGATVSLSASTTSSNVNLGAPPGSGEFQVRVYNAGSATAFLVFGNGASTAATTSDMPIPAGAVEVFTTRAADGGDKYAAAITSSGTATLYFTRGGGL